MSHKLLNPKNDYVFKRLFGSVGNETITKNLLSCIFFRSGLYSIYEQISQACRHCETPECQYSYGLKRSFQPARRQRGNAEKNRAGCRRNGLPAAKRREKQENGTDLAGRRCHFRKISG